MTPTLDADHRYWLDDVEVPGVSRILDASGFKTNYPDGDFKLRGTRVHEASVLLDQGKIIRTGPAIEPYIKAYGKFNSDFPGIAWDRTEEIIWHPELFYCGTVDRAGMLNGKRLILDLKTGTPPAQRLSLQLAAYCIILSHMEKIGFVDFQRWGCELRDDGSYKLHICNNPRDREVFIGLVHRYHWEAK